MVRINGKNIIRPTNALSKRQRESKYVLRKRIDQFPVAMYSDTNNGLNSDVRYISYVEIGKKNNDDYKCTVTTMWDKYKRIISRDISKSGENAKRRYYDYATDYVSRDSAVPVFNRRHILTQEILKDESARTLQEEDQFVYGFGRDKQRSKKLHINKNKYDYSGSKPKISASITEYPANNGLESADKRKSVELELELEKQIPKITKISYTPNVTISRKDEYYPYRFLLGEQKQISLTHAFLKENGLESLDVNVSFSPKQFKNGIVAYFDNYDGRIIYTKSHSNLSPVELASHEVDHAKRFAIIGQLGKCRTTYERKAQKMLGAIEDYRERQKGYEYLIASEQYPKITSDENLSLIPGYKNNLLEMLANQKARETKERYDVGRKKLQRQFKYVMGVNTL